jgi:hypothetical protein
LGAGTEFVRFMFAPETGPWVEGDEGIRGVLALGLGRRRSGRDGTANAGDAVASLEDFDSFSCDAETKLNGSIGCGVSNGKESSVPKSEGRFC